MPRSSATAAALTREIGTQAKLHSSPVFSPHVTLLPDIRRPRQEVVGMTQKLAARLKKYRLNFLNISSGSIYYQCVYLLCMPEAEPMAAAAEARSVFDMTTLGTYMPHLSLHSDLLVEKYIGGEVFNESVPRAFKYAELCRKLNDKFGDTVSFQYLTPGEELDSEELIRVTDDNDLQELYEEYDGALRRPGTPLKTFRIKVFVFPACQDVREVCEDQGDEDALMMEPPPDPSTMEFNPEDWCSDEDEYSNSSVPSGVPSSDHGYGMTATSSSGYQTRMAVAVADAAAPLYARSSAPQQPPLPNSLQHSAPHFYPSSPHFFPLPHHPNHTPLQLTYSGMESAAIHNLTHSAGNYDFLANLDSITGNGSLSNHEQQQQQRRRSEESATAAAQPPSFRRFDFSGNGGYGQLNDPYDAENEDAAHAHAAAAAAGAAFGGARRHSADPPVPFSGNHVLSPAYPWAEERVLQQQQILQQKQQQQQYSGNGNGGTWAANGSSPLGAVTRLDAIDERARIVGAGGVIGGPRGDGVRLAAPLGDKWSQGSREFFDQLVTHEQQQQPEPHQNGWNQVWQPQTPSMSQEAATQERRQAQRAVQLLPAQLNGGGGGGVQNQMPGMPHEPPSLPSHLMQRMFGNNHPAHLGGAPVPPAAAPPAQPFRESTVFPSHISVFGDSFAGVQLNATSGSGTNDPSRVTDSNSNTTHSNSNTTGTGTCSGLGNNRFGAAASRGISGGAGAAAASGIPIFRQPTQQQQQQQQQRGMPRLPSHISAFGEGSSCQDGADEVVVMGGGRSSGGRWRGLPCAGASGSALPRPASTPGVPPGTATGRATATGTGTATASPTPGAGRGMRGRRTGEPCVPGVLGVLWSRAAPVPSSGRSCRGTGYESARAQVRCCGPGLGQVGAGNAQQARSTDQRLERAGPGNGRIRPAHRPFIACGTKGPDLTAHFITQDWSEEGAQDGMALPQAAVKAVRAGAGGRGATPLQLDFAASFNANGESRTHTVAPPSQPSPGSSALLQGVVKLRREDVLLSRKIGEGAFGEVSQAHVFPYGVVAIKWLKKERFAKYSESFTREAEVLSKLNHPNIIRMYGLVVESGDAAMASVAGAAVDPAHPGAGGGEQVIAGIMTEFVRSGSLTQHLRSLPRPLSLKERCHIAWQATLGMAYLHKQSPAVVHFDLKPDNLLVDGEGENLVVKVADFGLSKHKYHSHVSCCDLRGTLPYMAPELLLNPRQVSERCDVWSMGVVMWEMTTLEVPFQELSSQSILMALMHGNLHLPIPATCEPEWRGLIEACLETDPSCRPSFQQLAHQLGTILTGLAAEEAQAAGGAGM
ncbi:MAG: hypothetical protein WDW38_010313 [Sanguina aurantia]